MKIEEDYLSLGKKYHAVYQDVETFETIPPDEIRQHHGICFYGDKIVICWHEKKQEWTLPGGKTELGETPEQTLDREVHEETNMRILSQHPVGYQRVTGEEGGVSVQLRSICIVEPRGEFVADLDHAITKIAYIEPSEWGQYMNLGEVGLHLIKRAQELRALWVLKTDQDLKKKHS